MPKSHQLQSLASHGKITLRSTTHITDCAIEKQARLECGSERHCNKGTARTCADLSPTEVPAPADEELRFSPGRQSSAVLLPPALAKAPIPVGSQNRRRRRRKWRLSLLVGTWFTLEQLEKCALRQAGHVANVRNHMQPRWPSHGWANSKSIFFCMLPGLYPSLRVLLMTSLLQDKGG